MAGFEQQLECPHCKGEFLVDASWLGSQVECPHCDQTLVAELPESEQQFHAGSSIPDWLPPLDEAAVVEPPQLPQAPLLQEEVPSIAPPPTAEPLAVELPESEPPVSGVPLVAPSPIVPEDTDSKGPNIAMPPPRADAPRTLRQLTPEEKKTMRHKFNLALGMVAALVLVLVFLLLLQLG